MKICILAPSEEYLNQAGVRIRYRRLEGPLAALGHELSVIPIGNFRRADDFTHDVYLVSKCYDARALVAAEIISVQGKRLGVDLFDDYFSQADDSRFVRLRLWLDALLAKANFVLCSTEAMRTLAQRLAPACPAHVMNDPYDRFDPDALTTKLDAKLTRLHQTRVLDMGWFGVGDNPHFTVGLADVVSYGNELARLRGHGFDVHLHILTNQRAMTTRALVMLKRLAIPYKLEEWSEQREAELLERCPACFLPVNAQPFSVVKSLNRAVTALTAGTQVLSAGFPLYEALSPYVYRDAKTLLDDLEERQPLLRRDTLLPLALLFETCASPSEEARRFAAFLECVHRPATAGAPSMVAAIHGRESVGPVHKFVQSMGGLSIATPLTKQKLNYDVCFTWRQGAPGVDILIANKKCHLLPADMVRGLSPHGRIVDTDYHRLHPAQLPRCSGWDSALGRMQDPVAEATAYGEVISLVKDALATLFPGISCVVSENSKLPLRIPLETKVA